MNFRIITAENRIKFAGTGMDSWFTLDGAKAAVDYNAGEMIYQYDNQGNRLFEKSDLIGIKRSAFCVFSSEYK